MCLNIGLLKLSTSKIKQLKDFGRHSGGNDIHDEFGINSKFTELQDVIRAYTLSIIKKDEAIPLVLTLFPVDDKGGKPY